MTRIEALSADKQPSELGAVCEVFAEWRMGGVDQPARQHALAQPLRRHAAIATDSSVNGSLHDAVVTGRSVPGADGPRARQVVASLRGGCRWRQSAPPAQRGTERSGPNLVSGWHFAGLWPTADVMAERSQPKAIYRLDLKTGTFVVVPRSRVSQSPLLAERPLHCGPAARATQADAL